MNIQVNQIYLNTNRNYFLMITEVNNNFVSYKFQAIKINTKVIDPNFLGVGTMVCDRLDNKQDYRFIKSVKSFEDFIIFLNDALKTRIIFD